MTIPNLDSLPQVVFSLCVWPYLVPHLPPFLMGFWCGSFFQYVLGMLPRFKKPHCRSEQPGILTEKQKLI